VIGDIAPLLVYVIALEKFASDEERAKGRWRLAITKMPVRFDGNGNAFLVLMIPVLKFLGTQFKCFVAVRSDSDEEKLEQRMRNREALLLVQEYRGKGETAEGQSNRTWRAQVRNRLYFVLNTFSTCAVGARRNISFLRTRGICHPCL
jgi:hypothetical protein